MERYIANYFHETEVQTQGKERARYLRWSDGQKRESRWSRDARWSGEALPFDGKSR
jgi:hypothetical protein